MTNESADYACSRPFYRNTRPIDRLRSVSGLLPPACLRVDDIALDLAGAWLTSRRGERETTTASGGLPRRDKGELRDPKPADLLAQRRAEAGLLTRDHDRSGRRRELEPSMNQDLTDRRVEERERERDRANEEAFSLLLPLPCASSDSREPLRTVVACHPSAPIHDACTLRQARAKALERGRLASEEGHRLEETIDERFGRVRR